MKKWALRITIIAFILLFFFLAIDSLLDDSPTFDEQFYISSGLSYLKTGDPRLNYLHPPLINMIIAAPLLLVPQIQLPLEHWSWQRDPMTLSINDFSDQLIWVQNRDLDIQHIFFLARMPVVFLTIFLALIGFRFSQELWGNLAPITAFILILFDPNIIAHGRYATTDIGGTVFAFLTTYWIWRLWERPNWSLPRWITVAILMGLAFSSKYTTIMFLPIWGLLAIFPLYKPDEPFKFRQYLIHTIHRLLQLVSAATIAGFLLWASFGFEWRQYLFQYYQRLEALNEFSGPLPTYFSGLSRHLSLSRSGLPAFLLGEISPNGFPQYFLLNFLFKTPILTIIFFSTAAIVLIILARTRKQALFLITPIVVIFTALTQNGINIGYRHILPILPFLFTLIAGLGSRQIKQTFQTWTGLEKRKTLQKSFSWAVYLVPIIVFLYLLIVDLKIHPSYLAYFNEFAGGPENGYRVLVDSNIDWGQDLLRLNNWVTENDIELLRLSWFGSSDPTYYDLEYEPLPGWPRNVNRWDNPPFNTIDPEPGIYAISATNLWGVWMNSLDTFEWFRKREPDHRIGYSILIYEVP